MIVTGIAVTIFAINLEKLNVPSYQNVVHTSIRNENSTPANAPKTSRIIIFF